LGDDSSATGLKIYGNNKLGQLGLALTGDYGRDMELGDAAFSFPHLASVKGTVKLIQVKDNTTFDSLTNVGALSLNKTSIKNFEAPRLIGVESDLTIVNGTDMKFISLPALQRVGGILEVSATNITTFTAPKLMAIGEGMHFSDNPKLELIVFSNLEYVGSICCGIDDYVPEDKDETYYHAIAFDSNDVLNNITMPVLKSVGADLQPGSKLWALNASSNPELMILGGFGELKTFNGSMTLSGNFTSIYFHAMANVSGSVNITAPYSSYGCQSFYQFVDGTVNSTIPLADFRPRVVQYRWEVAAVEATALAKVRKLP
jgi:hypothetical protein